MFDAKIKSLSNKWKTLEFEIDGKGWRDFIPNVDRARAKRLFTFRNELDSLLKSFCNKPYSTTKCVSTGSKKLDSDIDVTIEGNCIYENSIVLSGIYDMLEWIFPKNDLSEILIFFDMNFYLSNFAIR